MNKSPFLTFSICLLLAAATFAVYAQTAGYDFVHYDDYEYVVENKPIQEGLTPESLRWVFGVHASNWHPLTWLSHMLDYRLFGLNPAGHHLTSVLLHAANTVLLFLLLRRMTGAFWRSALAAALFGVHPLHVESVAWVAERKDVLSALFWILTTRAYVRYVERPGVRRYFWVVLPFALGLMAKPMLVTLPFTLLLLDYWPLNRFRGTGFKPFAQSVGRWVREKWPLFVLAALSCLVTLSAQERAKSLLALDTRAVNALVSYAAYLFKTVWPSGLAVFYPHPLSVLPAWKTLGSGIFVAGITFAAVRQWRRFPYLAVGWFWYAGTLVPVIGLVQVGAQAMADRYMYIPSIGLFVMIAWGGADLAARRRLPRAGIALCAGAAVLALTVTAWLQAKHWRNTAALFSQALRVDGENYFAHYQLGLALEQEGKAEKAFEHFAAAARILPNFAEAQNSLGVGLLRLGRYEEAMPHFTAAIKIKPVFPEAYVNMGAALGAQNQWREAMPWFLTALEQNPRLQSAHEYLGRAFVNQGKLEKAAEHFSRALKIKPGAAKAHNNLGFVLARLGRTDEAVAQLREAIRLQPSLAEAHFNLANILAVRGSLREAAGHYARAVAADAGLLEARHNLGVAQVKLGRLKAAAATFARILKRWPDFAPSRRAAQDLNRRLTPAGRRNQ